MALEGTMDLRHTFSIAKPIQMADIARYAILYYHGGWYFDMDTGAECNYGQLSRSGNNPSEGCSNDITELEKFVNPHQQSLTGIFVWEMGRRSRSDVMESAKRPCRAGMPEYRTRLANYAIWAQRGSPVMERLIRLTIYRVDALVNIKSRESSQRSSSGKSPCALPGHDNGQAYEVLWSTGPDSLTEAVLGIRDAGFDDDVPDISSSAGEASLPHHRFCSKASGVGQGELRQAGQQRDDCAGHDRLVTNEGALILDPRSHLFNANSWTWRT